MSLFLVQATCRSTVQISLRWWTSYSSCVRCATTLNCSSRDQWHQLTLSMGRRWFTLFWSTVYAKKYQTSLTVLISICKQSSLNSFRRFRWSKLVCSVSVSPLMLNLRDSASVGLWLSTRRNWRVWEPTFVFSLSKSWSSMLSSIVFGENWSWRIDILISKISSIP
jgi:hypothetical protein